MEGDVEQAARLEASGEKQTFVCMNLVPPAGDSHCVENDAERGSGLLKPCTGSLLSALIMSTIKSELQALEYIRRPCKRQVRFGEGFSSGRATT